MNDGFEEAYDSATEFAADCYHLWKAGNDYLPAVGNAYAEAVAKIGGSSDDFTDDKAWEAFTRASASQYSSSPVDSPGEVGKKFVALRDDVGVVLSRVSRRLYAAGSVMKETAKAMAGADTENANNVGSASTQLDKIIESDSSKRPEKLEDTPDRFGKGDEILDEAKNKK